MLKARASTLAQHGITTADRRLRQWGAKTTGRIKRIIFGGAIGLIACYKGFPCRPGAEGVGRACTEAFIVSFIAIPASRFFFATLSVASYLSPRFLWSFLNTSLRAQLQNRAAPVRMRGYRVLQAGCETAS
ncbi:MAG: hypothetical protein BroJett003_08190 [Planctomycetota bacterium]|nr:MAG: hypothetical protein BroJett003_08190 [Planctomycetota bacterium]